MKRVSATEGMIVNAEFDDDAQPSGDYVERFCENDVGLRSANSAERTDQRERDWNPPAQGAI